MSKEQFDRKIDQIARKAVEHDLPPFSEAAWDKMEKLLDKQEKRRRFIIFWWMLPLLFLAATTFYFWNKSNNQSTISQLTTTQNKTLTQRTEKENLIPSNTIAKEDTDINSESNKRTTEKGIADSLNTSTSLSIEEKHAKSIVSSTKEKLVNSKKGAKQPSLKTYNSTSKGNKQNINFVAFDSEQKTTVKNNEQAYNYASRVNEKLVPIASLITKGKFNTPPFKNPIDTFLKKSVQAKKTGRKNSSSKFAISALVAADMSSANFKNIDKISTAVGIGFSYNLSKRLSIATGFAISQKLYSADSTTYKNPVSLGSRYTIKGINANCLVFDIPLNLQYKIRENKNSSWYAIAGLSTYIMNKEKYDYDYDYYGQPKTVTYNINNQNTHLFSIFNLAAAYRKNFSKKFAWQLAPFAKIPLTGVGNGKINLYSLGLEFSVLYKK